MNNKLLQNTIKYPMNGIDWPRNAINDPINANKCTLGPMLDPSWIVVMHHEYTWRIMGACTICAIGLQEKKSTGDNADWTTELTSNSWIGTELSKIVNWLMVFISHRGLVWAMTQVVLWTLCRYNLLPTFKQPGTRRSHFEKRITIGRLRATDRWHKN